jgi:hypothetical protein
MHHPTWCLLHVFSTIFNSGRERERDRQTDREETERRETKRDSERQERNRDNTTEKLVIAYSTPVSRHKKRVST